MRLASIGMVKGGLDDVGQSRTLEIGNGKEVECSIDGADPAGG